jgi:hypothetical protein
MHYWRKGSLPTEERFLARIARMTDRQWASSKVIIQTFFVDGWRHPRIDFELAKAEEKAKARAASGSRGGISKALKRNNPALAKANDLLGQTPSKGTGKTLPSSSGLDKNGVSYETLVKTPVEDGVLPLATPLSNDAKERRKNDVDLCQDVVADWNALAADLGLPVVRDITPSRQAAIKSRSEDFKRTYDYADPRVGFSELMTRVRRSPFLRGDVRDFRCDFDFVVRASSFTKIMEGRYETQERAKGKR